MLDTYEQAEYGQPLWRAPIIVRIVFCSAICMTALYGSATALMLIATIGNMATSGIPASALPIILTIVPLSFFCWELDMLRGHWKQKNGVWTRQKWVSIVMVSLLPLVTGLVIFCGYLGFGLGLIGIFHFLFHLIVLLCWNHIEVRDWYVLK